MRSFNFCAGPAALPEAVLKQASEEMLNWRESGMSIMEMSHRSDEVVGVVSEAEQDLRDLLGVSDDYAVLFLQGGATSQFSAIPLNLLTQNGVADYVNTGQWSKKAIKEAKRFGNVNVAASSEAENFSHIPDFSTWQLSDKADYLHYTPNETIGGVEYHWVPQVDAPLVADMSSNILSKSINIDDYGLIYAGAQKNIGPAGLTVVIVRKDLLERAERTMPSLMSYKASYEAASMVNTPPTYSIYLAGLVFKWIKTHGGVAEMEAMAKRKAAKLYGAIDTNPFYSNPVALSDRSLMNVPFILADAALDKRFLEEADAAGLKNLAGHRSVGGMRASIYNAVPEAGVDALVDFMNAFASKHG